ncbi:MAG TPA: CARDB domain-containing protein [Saprospiraceae bacterium]|nr:CARDB domain-containing protein [Saprospiraceae bacterium]
MKTKPLLIVSAFFLLFFSFMASLDAQVIERRVYRPLKPNYQLRKPVLLRPDLLIVDQVLQYRQNGKRYIAIRVANKGNLKAAPNLLELRVSWRVDYEHWSRVERFQSYLVPELAPNAQYTIRYAIPDHEIHTNEGFGSDNISLRYFADQEKRIAEQDELNNIRTFYLPVLRN